MHCCTFAGAHHPKNFPLSRAMVGERARNVGVSAPCPADSGQPEPGRVSGAQASFSKNGERLLALAILVFTKPGFTLKAVTPVPVFFSFSAKSSVYQIIRSRPMP
eukprot:TRINITY_DN106635_c0_g1_i1.p2 TRINITY_DN106635_c0_g1~~TRINITY_DN106635_c0_g1_i1.p2  ORF type:complete len:105 (-),score=14.51 TRINITY_DN106635_c0_g1_i1:504-818(-)